MARIHVACFCCGMLALAALSGCEGDSTNGRPPAEVVCAKIIDCGLKSVPVKTCVGWTEQCEPATLEAFAADVQTSSGCGVLDRWRGKSCLSY